MPVNDEYTADRDRRRGRWRGWDGPERRIASAAGGQLLEQGDRPGGPIGNFAGSDSEFTTSGGLGSNEPNDWTHQRNQTDVGALGADDREGREPDEADPRTGGTGDEGGAATLGGGVYEGQGEPEDAPRYGDWVRHSTGTTSGARGHEGEDFSGENSFGEAQAETEREAAMGQDDKRKPEGGAPPKSTGEKMGKGKTQKGPTGEGQIGNAQTAEGGERNRKSGPPGQK
jgi:hypothetical protein